MKKNYKKWILVLSVLVIVVAGVFTFTKLYMSKKTDNTNKNQTNMTEAQDVKKNDTSVPQFENDEEEQKYIEKVMQEEEIIFEDSEVQEIDETSPQKTYESEDK